MDSDIIYLRWLKEVKEEGINRFLRNNRKDLLEPLALSFLQNNIPFDEARRYSNEIKKVLVTLKGQKGSGKYKGWAENVVNDYLVLLSEIYEKEQSFSSNENKNNELVKIDFNPLFESFLLKELKEVTKNNIESEHNIESYLFKIFFNEVFNSNWAIGKNEIPKWASQYFIKEI
jgi:hypothetical protein